ncbi:MAG: CDP-diacylglycerol--glycerol-3-phosphate 3-phosphatidyltransferase [Clostridia bacterium]|nr:CDP-diacylglycerol--glycerol-3-phosphate 3-phosphatidyltransferase [Clostridia bacterium]
MNLPNKLTVLRLCLVPVIIVVLLLPVNPITNILGALIFLGTALTDMLDGKIARKQGLVTDFGKFLDPLADKFMVISAMMCIMYRSHSEDIIFNVFMILVMVTVFRELAVASIRLIAAKNANIVVAANMLGKIKTVSQIVCVMAVLLEPVLAGVSFLSFFGYYPITLISSLITLVMTVWSGVVYIKTYWKYLDKNM